MRRIWALSFFLSLVASTMAQAPKSVEYEKDDFFLIVLLNPNFTLCDFKNVHINDRNTKLESENFYQSRRIKNEYLNENLTKTLGKCDQTTVHIAYMKISAAWRAYKEIQYRSECFHAEDKKRSNMFRKDNIWDKGMDKEIEHKLRIVPLKLVNY